ncbi:MAG: ABC transporter permease, partial [Gemmatimonadales bacterium]
MSDRRLRPGERAYRLLLRLYPRSFRESYEVELLQSWRDLSGEPRHRSLAGRFRFWRFLIQDVLASAPAQRTPSGPARAPRSRSTPASEPIMRDLILDLKSAIRAYRRTPGFTAAAILTLALGIGANTAVFSAVNGVLLKAVPVADADRLTFITREGDVSIPDGLDWRERSRSYESIALFLRNWAFTLTGQGEPQQLRGMVVEPEYFSMIGARPLLGRVLTPRDNTPGGPRVAVIAEGLWRRQFGADPGIVERSMILSDNPTTIVGVLPDRYDFLHDGISLWVPVATETPWALEERGTNNFDAVGKLRPGVPVESARQEMRAISEDLEQAWPRTNRGKIVEPIPLLDFMTGAVRPALLVLLAAVGAVLLLASVNLASLLLARSARRQEEFAVRTALGAGGWRLARQLIVEALLLSSAGGLFGISLAFLTTRLLIAVAPADLPRAAEISVDGAALLFAVGLAMVTGLIFGVIPALYSRRVGHGGVVSGVRGGTAGRGRHRTLRVLVGSEVAIAIMLLVGAGLLIRSFQRVWDEPLGFEPSRVLLGDMVLPESRYGTREPQTHAFQSIVDELNRTPGVSLAAYVVTPPLTPRSGIGGKVVFDGRPDIDPQQPSGARIRFVYGDYFRTMRLPVVRGRGFQPEDDGRAAPVAVVNQAFVRAFEGERDPIGARIGISSWGKDGEVFWMTIVGVASDVKAETLSDGDEIAIYIPYLQRAVEWVRFGSLVVRTEGDPAAMTRAVREAAWAVDPDLVLVGVQTLEERRA